MLPADSARRLVSLLTQALEECAEKRRQLQQDLALCHSVLGDWNSQAPDCPTDQDSSSDQQAREPSAKELEELELLNKALEKALKIRTKFLSHGPGWESAGAKASEKKPPAHVAIKQQGIHCKERVAESVKTTAASQKPASSRKSSVHVLQAPYRTDPEVKSLRGVVSARLNRKVSKGTGKKSPLGAASPKAKGPIKITRVECGKISAAKDFGRPPGLSNSAQDAKQNSLPGNSPCGGDFASTRTSSLETEPRLSGKSAPGMCIEPQIPTLQEKGSSLKLPLQFRKASFRVTRLWDDCCLSQMTPEAAAAQNHFMEKLQATVFNELSALTWHANELLELSRQLKFSLRAPSFSLTEVEKELRSLRGAYCLLSQCVETERAASLGENPAWEREYEGFLTLEGLQPLISQSLDKAHQLQEVVESYMQFIPASSSGSEASSSSMEDPFLQRPRSCCTEMFGPPPLLCYSSLKELQEVETLRLQVAMLRQQIDMQKALEDELLPLLRPGTAPEGSSASLYRAIYTLLCEGGERFPAFVNEEDLSSGLEPGLDGMPSHNL